MSDEEAMEAFVESTITRNARQRRQQFFYIMATLSAIFPFFAILVLAGTMNKALIWWTQGEVRRLKIKQRHFIRHVFLAEACLYIVLIASVVAVYTRAV